MTTGEERRLLPTPAGPAAFTALRTSGYVVLDDVTPDALRRVLDDFGAIDPFLDSWKYDVAVAEEVATLYTARGFGGLFPHLDKYEWERPPDLVALYGRRADRDGLGTTHVCDMTPFLEDLAPEDRRVLETTPVAYDADEGLQAVGINHKHEGPALDLSDQLRPRFRYSHMNAVFPANEPRLERLFGRAYEWFEANKLAVLLEENRLLVWSNTLVLHGRDAFTDPNRLIWRVYLRDRLG